MAKKLKFPNSIDSATFSKEINKIVDQSGLSYIDAVVYYCEKNNIEIETAAALVKGNFSLKTKIQSNGEQLNILGRKSKEVI